MTISLEVRLKGSDYKLSQFKPAHINALQAAITLKDASKKPTPSVTCLVRGLEKLREDHSPRNKLYSRFERAISSPDI